MVSQKWIDRVLKDERGYLDEQIYLDYLVLIIAKMADENNVVIIGRGSQYILNDHPDAFHILLVNEFENRVKFLIDRFNFSEKKATQVIINEDKRRLNLYSKIHKKDYDNPGLYHLVLNMNRLDLNMAENLVCQMMGARAT
jgi:cytidylate kinase